MEALDMISNSAAKPKGLLDLPGELRNRIYSAAIEGIEFSVTLRSAYLDYSSTNAPSNPNIGRPLLGLTQTSRKLRTEFLPIYMRTLYVHLDYSDVYDYLETFIWQGKPNEAAKFTHFNISLGNDIQRRHGHTENTYRRMNLAPLLRLYKSTPGFGLHFDENEWNLNPSLQQFMDTENTAWWEYMFRAIHRIHLSEDIFSWTDLDIIIKPEHEEWWMKYGRSKYMYSALYEQKGEWAERYGLSNEEDFDVGVDMGGNSDEGLWLM